MHSHPEKGLPSQFLLPLKDLPSTLVCFLNSVSPIFHVKCEPYREFQKEVQVTIEHFTKLEVEEDIYNFVFMVSRQGKEEFYPATGGVVTEIGSRYGTVMVNHFSRFGFFKRKGNNFAGIVMSTNG